MPPATNHAGKSPFHVRRNWMRLPLAGQLVAYRQDWLKSDTAAGLSVAAVSLPSAIAYPVLPT